MQVAAKKTMVLKDMDAGQLLATIRENDLHGFKEFLNSYKISDLLFLRGSDAEPFEYFYPRDHTFEKMQVYKDKLSIL